MLFAGMIYKHADLCVTTATICDCEGRCTMKVSREMILVGQGGQAGIRGKAPQGDVHPLSGSTFVVLAKRAVAVVFAVAYQWAG